MDHDRLFKELLRTFFVEFMELFIPAVAADIEPGSVEFLDKEVFTDITAGERHEVDLLAKVRFRGRPAYFLIHVETQASPQPRFPRRIFGYFARLDASYDLPVYPIVLFTYDAPLRPEPDAYSVAFPDLDVLTFRFRSIQLNRLHWRDYVRNANPVAAALMAKMAIEPADRPYVKLECLRLLATLRLDRARMQMIAGFVDAYLRLNAAEKRVFATELASAGPREQETIMKLTTSWEEEGIEKGLQRGKADLVLRQLRYRFGALPIELDQKVRGLAAEDLDALGEAFLDFTSVEDAQAWLSSRSA